MWDYVLFFACNVLVLVLSLFIWHWFPKPPAYDYTTIPGLKAEVGKERDGNLADVNEFDTFVKFLSTLTDDFGELASFYWGSVYVVAVGSWNLWKDLLSYDNWRTSILSFPAFYAMQSDQMCQLENSHFNVTFSEDVLIECDGSVELSWRLAIKTVFDVDLRGEQLKKLIKCLEKVCEVHECNLKLGSDVKHASTTTLAELSQVVQTDSVGSIVAQSLLCWAVQKCIVVSFANSNCFDINEALEPNSKFADLSKNAKSCILEIIRLAIPFDILVFTFLKEIDLQGHPIPPKYPIAVPLQKLFLNEKIFPQSTKFDPSRFLDKNTKTIAETLAALPFFDLFTEVIIVTSKIR